MAGSSIPAQLLAAIKGRKYTSIARLFANPVDFQGWTPTGHWVATDPQTAARIIEVWFSPGGSASTITWSNETSTTKFGTLEYEIAWQAQPDDQPRVLRQAYILTFKGDKIAAARVYCAGLHTEFPEVDLEKQRRQKGLGGLKPAPSSPRAIAVKAV